MNITKIYGFAGTGKTTYLMNKALEDGVGLYIVFNKSMQLKAKEIFPESIEVRTLHSLCYNLLEVKDEYVLTPKEIVAFMESMGVPMSVSDIDLDEGTYNQSSLGGRILLAINKSRNNFQPIEEVEGFDGDINELASEYANEKSRISKIDFTDMVERVAHNEGLTRYPTNLYVDEAQDFTPLQWLVINRLIKNTSSNVYIAGDEYQKIYTMLGVMDDFYFRHTNQEVILPRSYRLKHAMYAHAMNLSNMMTKVHPVNIEVSDGGVVDVMEMQDMLDYLSETKGERIFVLGRTKFSMMGIAGARLIRHGISHYLVEHGIPFLTLNPSHGGFTPWDNDFIDKFNTLLDLYEKGEADRTKAMGFALDFPAETKSDEKVRLKKGVKAKLRSMRGQRGFTDRIYLREFAEWFTETPELEDIMREGFTPRQRKTIIRYGLRRPPLLKDINIFIDTIHAAKGLEADTVFVDTSIPPRVERTLQSDSDDEVSDEYKVWHVAATRAINKLFYFDSGVFEAQFPAEEYI